MKDTITGYMGEVMDDGHIAMIVAKDGEVFRVPHIELVKKDNMVLKPVNLKPDFAKKHNFRKLTQHEVSCFIQGKNIHGEVIEPPSAKFAREEKEMREWFKTEEGKAHWEKMKANLKKFEGKEGYEDMKEIVEYHRVKYGLD